MPNSYRLNYGWAQIGPIEWDNDCIVTLQADLHAPDQGDLLFNGMRTWWDSLDRGERDGQPVAMAGGCEFPAPVQVNDHHVTAWIVSDGEDAFDSIAHHADDVRKAAEQAVPGVEITWTELPHQRPDRA